MFSWQWTSYGVYLTSSTYGLLCQGMSRFPAATAIWRCWAPLKCKIFGWLALQRRLWTSDLRHKHGLQDQTSPCFTCCQKDDTVEHILTQCIYARETWHKCLAALELQIVALTSKDDIEEWWTRGRQPMPKKFKKGFDSVLILTPCQVSFFSDLIHIYIFNPSTFCSF